MSELIFTVSQISEYIYRIFNAEELLHNIKMYGEVSNVSVSNGNIYFNIKDENALIQCMVFGTTYKGVLINGEQVLLTGTPQFYVKGGRLTFIARNVVPYGKGVLYQKYLELKQKLSDEGLFDIKYKQPIPKIVRRIGVVSSSTGAVIQDIINITKRRNDAVDIVLYPVKVQGIGAEEQIAKGINFFSDYDSVDVVIVARGGGSFEDLMPFNTEIVARACFNCKKPIISAVGHETDFSIIDFVADLRAPTPSAAAELAVIDRASVIDELNKMVLRMENALSSRYKILENKINAYFEKLGLIYQTILVQKRHFIDNIFTKVFNALNMKIENVNTNLLVLSKSLEALNPSAILNKGYAKVTNGGRVVVSINDLSVNDEVVIDLKDGSFMAVTSKIKGE